MLTLLEYLTIHKDKEILRISFRLIAALTPIVLVWTSTWLDDNVLQKVPHKVLWSISAILVASVCILLSYIKYIHREIEESSGPGIIAGGIGDPFPDKF